ncbi:PHP domain-containing protein [Streptomyces calidiresistens]|uniref:PHP domain-containing protein n=1 Tax=Streptomyces calidiresistens TaxID=1485586 RepID=A0A7W3T5Z1_9ACTN|nr:PHP domain-containing protein [Streptomyces calidiresistens]MBB0231557.1 PHP domain-containing protein [Streptomyces calidiresistens]
MRIDLHTHSTASDGTDAPADLMRGAAAAGLDVIALTDHDTVAGHAEAAGALPAGLTLVPGCELSCRYRGIGLHLLAYLFDPEEPALARERELLRDDRVPRARAIVRRLTDLGAPVEWERVVELAGPGGTIGRPHIATAMVEAGIVPDVAAAFTPEWIADGGRAHVDKHELDAVAAVRLVRAAGGVTVFAHPMAVKRGRVLPESAVAELAEAGLDGIEADHMDHDAAARRRVRELAGELGLLVTGSSDYHGSRKTCVLGEHTTDPDVYAEIAARGSGAAPITG